MVALRGRSFDQPPNAIDQRQARSDGKASSSSYEDGMSAPNSPQHRWNDQQMADEALKFSPESSGGAAQNIFVKRSAAMGSIIAMWVIYFFVTTGLSVLMGGSDLLSYVLPRIMVVAAGMICTFILYLILQRVHPRSFRARLAVALGMVVPLVMIYAAINMMFFYYWFPSPDTPQAIAKIQENFSISWQLVAILDGSVRWYFFFAVWAALYIAFGYANEMRALERRANHYQLEAKNAQLRALHYQIKPHFLFNTLNSLSTLVMRGEKDSAEAMIMNLSSFLRSCLEIESEKLVTLEEEIALQKLYLDIEQVRFPSRLQVDFHIPDQANKILVPSLILQPLIENAIKYGVNPSRNRISVKIIATFDSNHLYLRIENNVDPLAAAPTGSTGLGLNNVRNRLLTRFGLDASCEWGLSPDSVFIVTLKIPRGGEAHVAAAHINRR